MSEIFDSLKRKVADRHFGQITHEEWDAWSLRAKGKLPHFIATVEIGDSAVSIVDIYHDSLLNASGTASVLFQIGLPGIEGESITGIQITREDGRESRHLTPFRNTLVETVGAP